MFSSPKVILVALIFGAAVSPAKADYFYGALDIGQTAVKDACTGLPKGVDGCNDTDTLYRVAGGYQYTPEWGTEVSYADYGKAGAGMILGATVDWHVSGFQLSATGTFPAGNALFFLAKLGVARLRLNLSGGTSASATSTKLAFGIGAQYDITRNISGRLQYEYLGVVGDNSTGTSTVTLLSVGAVRKF